MDAQTRPQVFGNRADAVSHTAHRRHQVLKGNKNGDTKTPKETESLSLEANTG